MKIGWRVPDLLAALGRASSPEDGFARAIFTPSRVVLEGLAVRSLFGTAMNAKVGLMVASEAASR